MKTDREVLIEFLKANKCFVDNEAYLTEMSKCYKFNVYLLVERSNFAAKEILKAFKLIGK